MTACLTATPQEAAEIIAHMGDGFLRADIE
jgi:hypothetical protein